VSLNALSNDLYLLTGNLVYCCATQVGACLAFKQQPLLLNGFTLHFLGRFLEQSHRGAVQARFSGNVGNTHLVFAHHAGEMAADHGCASNIWF